MTASSTKPTPNLIPYKVVYPQRAPRGRSGKMCQMRGLLDLLPSAMHCRKTHLV